jgi:hypothetical protein
MAVPQVTIDIDFISILKYSAMQHTILGQVASLTPRGTVVTCRGVLQNSRVSVRIIVYSSEIEGACMANCYSGGGRQLKEFTAMRSPLKIVEISTADDGFAGDF